MEISSVKNVKMAESRQKMVGTCDWISKVSCVLPQQESISLSFKHSSNVSRPSLVEAVNT